jgi:hypothetical protein
MISNTETHVAVKSPSEYMVIGCGGVASYFLPSFLRTLNHMSKKSPPPLTLVDGDLLEPRNLERQQFSQGDAVKKVVAMEKMYAPIYGRKIKLRQTYFSQEEMINDQTALFCFADNHLARKHTLEAVDSSVDGMAICAANSTISSQAYVYFAAWKGTRLDPRVRYPEIESDESDSPLKIGDCNSEAVLDNTPQTAIANTMASTCALLLWNLWCNEIPKMGEVETKDFYRFPMEFFNTSSRMDRITISEELEKK